MNSLKQFFYNAHYVTWGALCSAVRRFFNTNKRRGAAELEEKKKIISKENAAGDLRQPTFGMTIYKQSILLM